MWLGKPCLFGCLGKEEPSGTKKSDGEDCSKELIKRKASNF
jgi:hypothetical protein